MKLDMDVCPHGEAWTTPCGFCEDEEIEVPQAVLDAAERRDRLQRKAPRHTS